ncbi:hypothetical protein M752DRAFT_95826 [Aspergillus phoenicis ATCC 13157]|uniref:Uncharacterized protein n=1 Tax=Aspergillus phoenicis ATCC 13157 TaxID=1353007 RepID=A0A370PUX6_ASPPH|nr:hypothetical protein M752DRAFT_95826 [Aspergillus phoenicis ATCC 13157]
MFEIHQLCSRYYTHIYSPHPKYGQSGLSPRKTPVHTRSASQPAHSHHLLHSIYLHGLSSYLTAYY